MPPTLLFMVRFASQRGITSFTAPMIAAVSLMDRLRSCLTFLMCFLNFALSSANFHYPNSTNSPCIFGHARRVPVPTSTYSFLFLKNVYMCVGLVVFVISLHQNKACPESWVGILLSYVRFCVAECYSRRLFFL